MSQNDNVIPSKTNKNSQFNRVDNNLAMKSNTSSIYISETNSSENYSNTKNSRLYVFSDIFAILLGFSISLVSAITINWLFPFVQSSTDLVSQLINIGQISSSLIVASGVIFWLANSGHYRLRMPFWMETKKIVSTLAFALLADGFLQFASDLNGSRLMVIPAWIISAFTMIALRSVVRKISAKRDSFQIPTLIIGTGIIAQQARSAIESAPEMGYKIVAQIKNLPEVFLQSGSSWVRLCQKYGVQNIVIALDAQELAGAEKIIAKLTRESIEFSVVNPFHNLPVTGMVPQYFLNHNTALFRYNSALKQNIPMFAKRTLDVMVSGSALIMLSPVMLVLAGLVKLDGGAAFFGHKRLGRNGKIFPCLKFRSMVMGGDVILKKHLAENPEAAAEWKATQKLQNDPRVTKLGKFLRASSLDELPQLINVLRGDMSLVGPRPIVKDEIAHYNHNIDYYYRVRPGVTGLWQVSGRNDVSYEQRVQMDSWYVRNWSLWHDIAIILKTVPAVFKRSGAY